MHPATANTPYFQRFYRHSLNPKRNILYLPLLTRSRLDQNIATKYTTIAILSTASVSAPQHEWHHVVRLLLLPQFGRETYHRAARTINTSNGRCCKRQFYWSVLPPQAPSQQLIPGTFYKNILTNSAVSSMNLGSMLIFASWVLHRSSVFSKFHKSKLDLR